MMNVVLGITVEQFSALRNEQNERAAYLSNHCFVCGEHRSRFEQMAAKSGSSAHNFENHIKHEHNMWNYIKFIAYLKHKDPTEYTARRWK